MSLAKLHRDSVELCRTTSLLCSAARRLCQESSALCHKVRAARWQRFAEKCRYRLRQRVPGDARSRQRPGASARWGAGVPGLRYQERTAAIRVMLVDDHQLFRAAIRSLLQQASGIEIIAEAGDGRAALHLMEERRPDVVLMDLMMPGLNGLDATAHVARQSPGTPVVILSMNAGEDAVIQALRAGAAGYLIKTADPAELALAVRAVARGEIFLSSAISQQVVTACLGQLGRERISLERLPSRQREVLQLIAQGQTTGEIAQQLGISPNTAETCRRELMTALDIYDLASLTRYAIQMGAGAGAT